VLNDRRVWPKFVTGLLDDHAKLALLECRYEGERLLRRLCVIVVGGFFTFTAYVFMLIALVRALEKWGSSLGEISLGLAVVHGFVAVFLVSRMGRRDPRAGRPFEGTLEEWDHTLQWIQKFF
jgi:hypothetical protein